MYERNVTFPRSSCLPCASGHKATRPKERRDYSPFRAWFTKCGQLRGGVNFEIQTPQLRLLIVTPNALFLVITTTFPISFFAKRPQTTAIMAGKTKGENTKKVAGNAKKAEAAATKAAVENAQKAQAEEQDWSKGAKSNAKKYVPSVQISVIHHPKYPALHQHTTTQHATFS